MMRIHGLYLHNIRGISQLELSELPETGVVVIHGDNEAGKSTIMDAIDACLNYKYSGFPKDIKSLVPTVPDGRKYGLTYRLVRTAWKSTNNFPARPRAKNAS